MALLALSLGVGLIRAHTRVRLDALVSAPRAHELEGNRIAATAEVSADAGAGVRRVRARRLAAGSLVATAAVGVAVAPAAVGDGVLVAAGAMLVQASWVGPLLAAGRGRWALLAVPAAICTVEGTAATIGLGIPGTFLALGVVLPALVALASCPGAGDGGASAWTKVR